MQSFLSQTLILSPHKLVSLLGFSIVIYSNLCAPFDQNRKLNKYQGINSILLIKKLQHYRILLILLYNLNNFLELNFQIYFSFLFGIDMFLELTVNILFNQYFHIWNWRNDGFKINGPKFGRNIVLFNNKIGIFLHLHFTFKTNFICAKLLMRATHFNELSLPMDKFSKGIAHDIEGG